MTKIRLRSITFQQAIRLPGSSSTAHYIPAADYPLVMFPEWGIIEAKLKDGVTAMLGQERRRWYHLSNMKDCDPVEESLPPETSVTTNEVGALVVPTARMKLGPGGSFERMTDEEAEAEAKAAVEAPAPKKRGGRRAKAAVEAPATIPAPAPRSADHAGPIVNMPRARTENLGRAGGA